MAELAGRSVVLKVSGAAVAMTGEATTGVVNDTAYQIANAAKQVIDWASAVTVLETGVATTDAYTINYLNGIITFAAADAGRGVITVTGKYLPMSVAAHANDYSSNMECDAVEAPRYGLAYKRRIPTFKSASGVFANIDVTDSVFIPALRAGTPIVVEVVPDTGILPERFLALLTSVADAFPAAGIQERKVGWVSTDQFITLGV